MFVVIGRFSRTTYGPFGTVAEAVRFIKFDLRSNERMYDVEVTK